MRRFLKHIPLLLLLSIFFSADLMAQTGGFAGAYSRMGFGPRGMAMGNAMGTVSQQGTYSYYNPALSAFTTNGHVDFTVAAMSFDRQLNGVSASFHLPPSAGIHFGILNANVTDFDGRTSSGYHTDYFNSYETQIFSAFGIRITDFISIGISVKGLIANFNPDVPRSTGAAVDLGMIISPFGNLRIGFSVHDIIAEYRWDSTDLYGAESGSIRNDAFPVRYKFSSSYIFQNELIISAEYEILNATSNTRTVRFSQTAPPVRITDRPDVSYNNHIIRAGSAYPVHERVTLRAGFEIMDLDEVNDSFRPSAGFSVHLPFDRFSPAIDYAFVREQNGIANMHVFAIRLDL